MWKESVLLGMVIILSVNSGVKSFQDEEQLEKDEIIKAVNKANTTWKAGRNFHPSIKSGYSKILLGLRRDPFGIKLPELVDSEDDIDVPETFDARDKWKRCIGLQTIRDQGNCGSCWAVASASVFTDRLCIASKGEFNSQLSAEDLLACGASLGCQGGYPRRAFLYFENKGIVTGGDYNSNEGCQPYTIPNCDHHVKGKYNACVKPELPTPECQTTCYNKDYKSSFFDDLHYIKTNSSFSITSGNIKLIQKEIYKNGPLVAAFSVYEDLFSYKTGVYKHFHGKYKGDHAVRVIGWGVENNTDYWLVANSWNEDWGNKGYFKIRRGNNECEFETQLTGGVPDLHKIN